MKFLKQILDLVKGILLWLLVLHAPLLGDLDLLLCAVFPRFVPAGLVVSLKVKCEEKIRL